MHNYKLIIAYDGSGFSGWQKGSGVRTVEQTLQDILEKKLQHPVTLQAASRTDAGVHAAGQVVNFFSPMELETTKFCLGVNRLLPEDVRILGAEKMDFAFHPTLDNTGKEYRYKIQLGIYQNPLLRHRAWHVYYPMNRDAMEQGARYFIGTHDFEGFSNNQGTKERESTVRTIRSLTFHDLDDHLEIRIVGDSFLYKMVRNIIGTLVDVGIGDIDAEEIPKILQHKDRVQAGVTAPAHGLTLYRLLY